MNKAFRLIWSAIKEAWIVVAEKVASKGGIPATVSLSAAALMLAASTAAALPTGAQIVHGTAGINTVGTTMTITNSPNTIINWQGFSIAANEATHFIQQSAASAVLNRVVGGNASQIYGTLQSNGKVFLINQNGILFGAGSTINVNGLVASTLNLTNEDFLAGKMKFSGELTAGKVVNEGTITTPTGGSVYLIAPNVENSGIITAPNGDILLAAGKEVLLVEKDNPEIATVVTAPEGQALNLGTLTANAGRIGVYGSIVRQKGIISANSAVQDASGKIYLKATKEVTVAAGSKTTANGTSGGNITMQALEGTTLVSGTIEAKGAGTKGGTVQLLGQQVGLIDQAKVDVSGITAGGTVLVGGDYQGKNAAVQNAQANYMGKDAVIKADATNNGNGGKVILWADDVTRAYGSIFARGGANGGDGGFVETSGKGYLDFNAYVSTLAPHGKAGSLLLDPTNIWIAVDQASATAAGMSGTDNSADIIAPSIFATGSVNDSFLGTSTLTTALQSSSVTVSTTNASGSGAGNITLVDSLTGLSNMGANTLTLTADNNININAEISGSTVAPAIVMNAGGILSINGNITVDNSVSLSAGTINIGNTANSTINITGGGFTAVSQTGFNLGTGSFTGSVSATSVVSIYNQVSGGINIGSNGTLNSNNASLNFTEMKGGALLSGSINAGTGTITMVSDSTGTVSQTTGTITAAGLKLQGTGSFSLLGTNAVAKLAGNPTGAGGISFNNSAALTIDTIGGNTTLQSAGDITLITTSGNISILRPVTSSGSITLQSAGTITQAQPITGSILTTSSIGGTVLENAANAVSTFSATNTTSGQISFKNSTALSIGSVAQSASDLTTIESTGNLTLGAITSNMGVVTLRSHNGSIIDGNANAVNVTGAYRVDFNDATTTTPGATGTSIDAIEVSSLNIGGITAKSGNGGIYISNDTSPLAISGISHTGTTGDIVITSAGNITVPGSIVTTSGNNNISITATGTATLTTSAAINKAGSGLLKLEGDAVTLNSNLFGNSGNIELRTGSNGLTINNVSLSAENITLISDKMALGSSSSISANTSGTVWLKPKTSGTLIDLGSLADNTFNTLELSAAELATITSAGILRIGDLTAGTITVSDAVASTPAVLSLLSGGSVTQSGSGFLTANSLAIQSVGSVDLSGNANIVQNIAVSTGDSTHLNNTIKFQNSGSLLNLETSLDGISGISATISGIYDEAAQDGFLSLVTGGAISQSAGALINMKAARLEGTVVSLTENNGTGVVAGYASEGNFAYNSNNSISAAKVDTALGITATVGDINLTSSGSVSQTQQLSAAGIIGVSAATGIMLTNATAPTVQLTNSTSGDINFTGNGDISIGATNSASTGNISLQAATGNMMLSSTAAGRNIYARALTGDMNINGTVTSSNGLFLAEAQNISHGMMSTISAKNVQLDAAGTLTLTGTINAVESIELKTDNLTIDPVYTRLNVDSSSIQHEITIKTYTAGRQISIGSGAGLVVSETNETIFNSPTLVIGDEGTLANGYADASGALQVNAAIARTGRLALISGADITQSAGATVSADELGLITSGSGNITLSEDNAINKMIAKTDTGNITLKSTNALTLVEVIGGIQNPETYTGIATNSGNVSLTTTGGDLTLNKSISAGSGAVSLTASGALVDATGGTGVTAASFAAAAGGDIGSTATPFMTQVSQWGAITSTTGSIYLENYGAVASGSPAISAASGDIVLKAHSPLTIGIGGVSAGGNITLAASASGGADDLTLNGPVSAGGSLTLEAGSAIVETVTPTAGSGITRTANLNNPTAPVVEEVIPPALETETPAPPLYEESNNGGLVLVADKLTVAEGTETETSEDEDKKTKDNSTTTTGQGERDDKPKKNYCN